MLGRFITKWFMIVILRVVSARFPVAAVGNIISCHYVRGLYRVGNTIEINDVKGKIIKITGTFVVVETDRGQVSVPANAFSETNSTLLE